MGKYLFPCFPASILPPLKGFRHPQRKPLHHQRLKVHFQGQPLGSAFWHCKAALSSSETSSIKSTLLTISHFGWEPPGFNQIFLRSLLKLGEDSLHFPLWKVGFSNQTFAIHRNLTPLRPFKVFPNIVGAQHHNNYKDLQKDQPLWHFRLLEDFVAGSRIHNQLDWFLEYFWPPPNLGSKSLQNCFSDFLVNIVLIN